MTQNSALFCLRAPVSLAFKTPSGPDFGDFSRTYGSGFNAVIEIAWTWTESLNQSDLQLKFWEFVKKIDHKHLGIDETKLGITTPESLLKWAADYFSQIKIAPQLLRLSRGEDIAYRLELASK